jgi:hypothetical protein
VSYINQN